MKHRLTSLLLSVFGCILAGFIASPVVGILTRSSSSTVEETASTDEAAGDAGQPVAKVEKEETPDVPAVSIDEEGGVAMDDSAGDDTADQSENGDDDDWSLEDGNYITEREGADAYMQDDEPAELLPHLEDDVSPDPKFTGVTKASAVTRIRSVAKAGEKLAAKFAKQESSNKKKCATGFRKDDLKPADWKDPERVTKTITERVLAKLGKCDDAAIEKFLESPENRLDLARLTMIRKVGISGLRQVAEMKMGTTFLAAFTSDLDWMTGVFFSGPTGKEATGLKYMATIYAQFPEEMTKPVPQRIAGTTAMEFARDGYNEKQMIERFKYYFTSYKHGRLNRSFDDLHYWETRIVCGCPEPTGWGSPVSLAWQRDNVRLPAEGYLSACNQLVYRLRNVAGDSVFSGDYLAPVMKHMNNTTAWAHREIGGVCGACSHYGAFGALANGIPAMTMGEPGHCAYTVRVNGQWKMSYSIYWQHGMHKTFWNMHDWDFLILTQDLYSDRYRTQASDFWLALAEFFAYCKMEKPAMYAFEGATAIQPLNWPAWVAYASYVKQKAPKDIAHWRSINDRIVDGMNVKFHDAAATFLTQYVYPHLLPLMPNKGDRNKMFAEFFKKCDNFGTNRWDITKFLNVQMAGCKDTKEQLAYMKDALHLLMTKPDYKGPVLAWGLDFTASLSTKDTPGAAKLQDEFSDLIIKALSRSRAGKKEMDETWKALGEAANAAAGNGDVRTFQAIGRLAMRKCKKKFPKNKFKFRPVPGKVISSKGLITTAVTLTEGQISQSCLHWAVLQRTGGAIPAKFEGKNGMKVTLDDSYQISGVVVLFNTNVRNDRPFHVEVSEDGQNWTEMKAAVEVKGAVIRVDAHNNVRVGRYVRLTREGGKYENVNVVGFYVYGKQIASRSGKTAQNRIPAGE